MSWIAVAIGGSALLGYFGSQNAANIQAGSANQATQTQQNMFNQTQANLKPYMGQGTQSLAQLGQQFGSASSPGNQPFGLQQFQASPAYQFNLQQGQQAIDKAANAKGNLYAPQTLQDISTYSQGVASNEFQNAYSNYNNTQNQIFSRLSGIAGSGQNAAANLGAFSGQVGGQIGSNQIGAGNAQAAGQVGGINAVTGAAGQFSNYALMQQILGQGQGLYSPNGQGQWNGYGQPPPNLMYNPSSSDLIN
jgi:hypothetical protein